MDLESRVQEEHDKETVSRIESAKALIVIFRRILTPTAIHIGPLEDPGPGPYGGFFSGNTISIETLFRLKGIEDKLGEVFEKETVEDEEEGSREIYRRFTPDGKQHLANILGKRIEFAFQESGLDPAGQQKIPNDTDEAVKRLYQTHPYATGTWYPEKGNDN